MVTVTNTYKGKNGRPIHGRNPENPAISILDERHPHHNPHHTRNRKPPPENNPPPKKDPPGQVVHQRRTRGCRTNEVDYSNGGAGQKRKATKQATKKNSSATRHRQGAHGKESQSKVNLKEPSLHSSMPPPENVKRNLMKEGDYDYDSSSSSSSEESFEEKHFFQREIKFVKEDKNVTNLTTRIGLYPSRTRFTANFDTIYLNMVEKGEEWLHVISEYDEDGNLICQRKMDGTFVDNKPLSVDKYKYDPWGFSKAKHSRLSNPNEHLNSSSSYKTFTVPADYSAESFGTTHRLIGQHWFFDDDGKRFRDTFRYDWMKDHIAELINRLDRSTAKGMGFQRHCSFMPAWKFINIVMDDPELIDYGYAHKQNTFIWHMKSFAEVPNCLMACHPT